MKAVGSDLIRSDRQQTGSSRLIVCGRVGGIYIAR